MSTEHMGAAGTPEERFAAVARFHQEFKATTPNNAYENRFKNPAWNVWTAWSASDVSVAGPSSGWSRSIWLV